MDLGKITNKGAGNMPEKAEDTKPETTGDKKTDEDPLADARAEAIRQNPQWQTQQLDTSDSTQHVDIRTISPAFEEARQQAVRAAAEAVDEEGYLPANVIPPDDENDTERAREDVRRQAAELPEDTGTSSRSANAPDGQGGPYGQGVIPSEEDQKIAEEQERKAQESAKTESKSSSSTTKPTTAKTTTSRSSSTAKNTTK